MFARIPPPMGDDMKKNILFLSLMALPVFALAENNLVLPTIKVSAEQQVQSYAANRLNKQAMQDI